MSKKGITEKSQQHFIYVALKGQENKTIIL